MRDCRQSSTSATSPVFSDAFGVPVGEIGQYFRPAVDIGQYPVGQIASDIAQRLRRRVMPGNFLTRSANMRMWAFSEGTPLRMDNERNRRRRYQHRYRKSDGTADDPADDGMSGISTVGGDSSSISATATELDIDHMP